MGGDSNENTAVVSEISEEISDCQSTESRRAGRAEGGIVTLPHKAWQPGERWRFQMMLCPRVEERGQNNEILEGDCSKLL